MNKHFDSLCFVKFNNFVCTYFLLFPKQYTYMFSMLFFIQYPDPDPGFKFLWIRFSDFSGSGSGFNPRIPEQNNECRKGSNSY